MHSHNRWLPTTSSASIGLSPTAAARSLSVVCSSSRCLPTFPRWADFHGEIRGYTLETLTTVLFAFAAANVAGFGKKGSCRR